MANLDPDRSISVAHEPTSLEFARSPSEREDRLASLPPCKATVLLGEVQRLPSLLNTVQVLLDRPGNRLHLLLTGSSARRLRRDNANPRRIVAQFVIGQTICCVRSAMTGQVRNPRSRKLG